MALASLGYLFGPVNRVSLPRTAVVTARVDQANNVTAVLATPPPAEVAAYLRRALPVAGFTLTDDDPAADTLTFTGYGWTGSFTGDDRLSALLLRPA